MGDEPTYPIIVLMAAGLVRDELPWLYELAVDAYRAAHDASPEKHLAPCDGSSEPSRCLTVAPSLRWAGLMSARCTCSSAVFDTSWRPDCPKSRRQLRGPSRRDGLPGARRAKGSKSE